MRAKRSVPADVRGALAAFLSQCQNEARPFAGTEALGAIRTMFPELDISDGDLEDAISGQAEEAGFDVGYEVRTGTAVAKAAAIERWENEAGATTRAPRMEAQRRIDNDTDGTRRRAKGQEGSE
ncbi:hypothetical protein [Mesorhizobium marinum]|uniref:hypothetical protein n=1 Tax=Mesorhizobium marinum TaxID=3228790 RepID=UPI003464E95C